MAGTRGPVGKHPDERVSRHAPNMETTTIDVAKLVAEPIEIPAADENWHPIARSWYESLQRSAVCSLYEPSDWMTAYVVAETMSRELKPQFVGMEKTWNVDADDFEHTACREKIPIKGASLNAMKSFMAVLMTTVGDRRRMAIEIARETGMVMPQTGTPLPSNVSDLAAHRREQVSS